VTEQLLQRRAAISHEFDVEEALASSALSSTAYLIALGLKASTSTAGDVALLAGQVTTFTGPLAAAVANRATPTPALLPTQSVPTMQAPFYHFTTEFGRQGIQQSKIIAPGTTGLAYVTTTPYPIANEAQAELSLSRTPTGYFTIPAERLNGLSTPSRVEVVGEGPTWQPDGGIECTLCRPIDAQNLDWQPIEHSATTFSVLPPR
jgi:hypothetical protein